MASQNDYKDIDAKNAGIIIPIQQKDEYQWRLRKKH